MEPPVSGQCNTVGPWGRCHAPAGHTGNCYTCAVVSGFNPFPESDANVPRIDADGPLVVEYIKHPVTPETFRAIVADVATMYEYDQNQVTSRENIEQMKRDPVLADVFKTAPSTDALRAALGLSVPAEPDKLVSDYFDRHIERLFVGRSVIDAEQRERRLDNERRVKIIRLSTRQVLDVLFLSGAKLPDYIYVLRGPHLPPDAEVLPTVHHDFQFRCFVFMVRHPSFDVVPDGMPAPNLNGPVGFEYEAVPLNPRHDQRQAEIIKRLTAWRDSQTGPARAAFNIAIDEASGIPRPVYVDPLE